MLKIVIIFMLLTVIGSSISNIPADNASTNNTLLNNSLLNNSLLNNSLLNNSSLNGTNGTQQSSSGIDSKLFDWFAKPTKQSLAPSLFLVLDDVKRDYIRITTEPYTINHMTESDFSRLFSPPEIGDGRVDRDPYNKPDPVCDSDDCPKDPDAWINIPPWETDVPGRGCSELTCDEEGICHAACFD